MLRTSRYFCHSKPNPLKVGPLTEPEAHHVCQRASRVYLSPFPTHDHRHIVRPGFWSTQWGLKLRYSCLPYKSSYLLSHLSSPSHIIFNLEGFFLYKTTGQTSGSYLMMINEVHGIQFSFCLSLSLFLPVSLYLLHIHTQTHWAIIFRSLFSMT